MIFYLVCLLCCRKLFTGAPFLPQRPTTTHFLFISLLYSRTFSAVMNVVSVSVSLLVASAGVLAAPSSSSVSGRAVTALSATSLSAFAPFTQFARAAYCSGTANWQCGAACDALPGFLPTLTGGDGNAEQFFFVGFYPTTGSVIVTHEGTDPTKILSDLTDIDILKEALDTTLFPGIPSGILAHRGFVNEHKKTAAQILVEVKRLLALHSSTSVTLIGHSLGGALAELDSLFMRLNLPADIYIKGVTYGTPRVGNQAFATFFDTQVSDFTRINNEIDLIPILPGRFLGFEHPHGEVHILSPGNAVLCSGDDDTGDAQCIDKAVPNIFKGNILNHLGPYDGISIGAFHC
ncbi:alpha/beta-hydrolase [Artomyces pyxidatus]|uniref:Alpha/beta-hydrolase n=1 Tax=Artomyces pyxidatus TaxID=48021 RepID=A0ACB8SYC4_9AGAM|nr:alpha/beta-hydrolase [Artomyces pyxidatus]